MIKPAELYVWRYLFSGKVKHVLTKDQLSIQSPGSTCGVMPLWYLPPTALWQDDAQGLAARPECRNCVSFLKQQGWV